MLQTRISTPADIPRQRELWQLAFGDGGAYVDNFYHTYYKPERMLMLEEDGVVQAMTPPAAPTVQAARRPDG